MASNTPSVPFTWECPHGVVYSGSDDFISGARNAHDEAANRAAFDLFSVRSFNDIAQDIIDAAPQVEPLVEEWFVTLNAAKERWAELRCPVCGADPKEPRA